ncbi:hypothetical protein ACG02S_26055 [Roseateles sp. DC23W]|uniref:MFS transporter, DHA2 family, multidrug resistance protein n=1 Tax=Pelomonas dachongensis TaxID=3299029 RepID=A0ABW7EV26_9BURK
MRITAGAFDTSITTTLWDNRATLHHANLTEGSGAGQNTAEGLGALAKMRMSAQQAAAQLNRIIDQQSFTRAADDIFLGSAVMFTLLIGVVWLSKPSMSSSPVNDGGAH